MNHQEVRRRLGEYLDGDLALGQRALLDAHLDACDACAGELRALRATVGLLRGLPAPEAPAHLAERVVARIQDGEGRARFRDGLAAAWNAIDPARYLPPLAAAALTSAVVIVGVRDLGWQIPGMRAPEPTGLAAVPSEPTELAAVPPAPQAAAPAEAPPLPEPTALAEPTGLAAALPAPLAAPSQPASAPFANEPRREIYAFEPAPRGVASPDASVAEPAAAPPAPGLQGPFGASAAPEEPALPRPGSPEADLELALEDPRAFVARFHRLGRPEAQEAWLAAVASQATRRRSLPIVIQRLRETAGPEGHALATRFEAVAYPVEGR